MREFNDIVLLIDVYWLLTQLKQIVVCCYSFEATTIVVGDGLFWDQVPFKTPRKTLLISSQMILYSLVMGWVDKNFWLAIYQLEMSNATNSHMNHLPKWLTPWQTWCISYFPFWKSLFDPAFQSPHEEKTLRLKLIHPEPKQGYAVLKKITSSIILCMCVWRTT